MVTQADSIGSALIDDLAARNLIADHTDMAALVKRLEGPTRLYCGFDPTADSLHLGNLQSIMLLRRFQLAGHAPVALVGGATGMIGDPSGRKSERTFLDPDVLDSNRVAIGAQLEKFLDFTEPDSPAALVDNRTWTEPLGLLEFLRDVGKHVTVNTMLSKESVRGRMDRESGISFTEFSYMLLQANDYMVLHETQGVDLQVAGSDQWGNITAGVDLIRRRSGDHVHGLTAPLILRSDGSKFGKSEGENIWLSAERTSAYQMYQYLLNMPDADIGPLLLRLTTVPVEDCLATVVAHEASPEHRSGQRRLARELVALVHGEDVIGPVESAAAVLFGGAPTEADPATLELLAEEVPTSIVTPAELDDLDLYGMFTTAGLARSKGEVRKNAAGYHINGRALPDWTTDTATAADLLHGRYVMLRKGRRNHHILVVVG